MSNHWKIGDRTPRQRSYRIFDKAALRLAISKRFDILLVVTFLLGIGLLLLLIAAPLIGAWLFGWFNPPTYHPVPDERKLVNLRDNLPAQPLLDAVLHLADNRIYVSQAGGLFHRYDPQLGLWDTLPSVPDNLGLSNDLVLLQSGCSNYLVLNPDCPDRDSIWAMSADNGLLRFNGKNWDALTTVTRFIGLDGSPMTRADITAAAVATDEERLVLGTNGQGLGLYNLSDHTWREDNSFSANLRDMRVKQIVYWENRFWVATEGGLFVLDLGGNTPTLERIPSVQHDIVDMDADDALWVLEHRPCVQNGDTCLWMGRFDTPDSQPVTIIDERNNYPDLSLSDLHYVQLWNDQLIFAGVSGIFSYDNVLHAWERLSTLDVQYVLPRPDGTSFYFAYTGGIGFFANGSVNNEWEYDGEPVANLMFAPNNGLYILARNSNNGAYSLHRMLLLDGTITDLHIPSETSLNPETFILAIPINEYLLFVSTEGATLLNTDERTYVDITKDDVPSWLRESSFHFSTQNTIFIFRDMGSRTEVYSLAASDLVDLSYYSGGNIRDVTPRTLNDVKSYWVWDNDSMGILDGNNQIRRLTRTDNTLAAIGEEPTLANNPPTDMAVRGDEYIFSNEDNIFAYSLQSRTWSDVNVPLTASEQIEEIAVHQQTILVRTSTGRLVSSPNIQLIGGSEPFEMEDDELSDAWQIGQNYYLAGAGGVAEYNAQSRAITDTWQISGSGNVELKNIINDTPLFQIGDDGYWGTVELQQSNESLASLSADSQYVWSVRERNDTRYLVGQPIGAINNDAQFICLFRNPTAGARATAIYDARAISSTTIAVATNDGLKFYDTSYRSWYDAPSSAIEPMRLYILGDYLLVLKENNSSYELQFVELSNIDLPNSCLTSAVTWGNVATETVKSVSVDERNSRAVWLTGSGEIELWVNGRTSQILDNPNSGPATADLRGIYDRSAQGYLLFTTTDELWRYDLAERLWQEINITQSDIAYIDVVMLATGDLVAVTQRNGNVLSGTISAQHTLTLRNIDHMPNSSPMSGNIDTLLDVQQWGDYWAFVLQDGIRFLNPDTRLWHESSTMPVDLSLRAYRAAGRGVVTTNNGATWWVAVDNSTTPSNFTPFERDAASEITIALDEDGTIWRYLNTGNIESCARRSNAYSCQTVYTPFYLNPTDVNRALEWQNVVIFETSSGIHIFENDKGTETNFNGLESFGVIQRAQRTNTALLLFAADEVAVINQDLEIERHGFDELVFDNNRTPWLLDGDVWLVFVDGKFEPAISANLRSSPHSFVIPDLTATGINDNGELYYWENERFVEAPYALPDTVISTTVDLVVRGIADDWWLVIDGQVQHYIVGNCANEGDCYLLAGIANTSILEPVYVEVMSANSISVLNLDGQAVQIDGTTAEVIFVPDPNYTPTPEATPDIEATAEAIITSEVTAEATVVSAIPPGMMQQTIYSITPATLSIPELPDTDDWSTLQTAIGTLANGQTAFDPILSLNHLPNGQLSSSRASGITEVWADNTATSAEFVTPPAIDAGWLLWDRATNHFIVQTNSGELSLTAAEFMPEGQFIFAEVDAFLMLAANEIYTANSGGIWQFSDTDLSLNDASILYYPTALTLPIRARHGYFLSDGEQISINGNQLLRTPMQSITVTLGDVQFTENLQSGQISGHMTIGDNAQANPFTRNGFLWDSNRRGVAFNDSLILLQSDAGIHTVSPDFTNFDSGPDDTALSTATLFSLDADIYLTDSNNWQRLQGGSWQTNANPFLNRTLVQNGGWNWSLIDGSVVIQLADDPFNFALRSDAVGFTSDILQTAIAHGDELYILTDAFFERGSLSSIHEFTATRSAGFAADDFEVFHHSNGQIILYNYAGANIGVWNATNHQFEPITSNPRLDRETISNERLSFTLVNGRMQKEVLLNNIDGSSAWAAFDLSNGRFPFDEVTTLTVVDDVIYVGTSAGLQVYSSASQTGIMDMTALYDFRANNSQNSQAVELAGLTAGDRHLYIARGEYVCLQMRQGLSFSPCTEASLVETRWRYEDSMWIWTRSSDNLLEGHYIQSTGAVDVRPITFPEGHFPHDNLDDARVCNNIAYTVWSDIWVTVHENNSFALTPTTQQYQLASPLPERLLCVEAPQVEGNTQVAPGLYILSSNDSVVRFENNQWQTVTSTEEVNLIEAYAANPIIYQTPRLRLRDAHIGTLESGEYRTLDNHWLPLVWSRQPITGGFAMNIDRWQYAAVIANELWAVTEAGLIPLNMLPSYDLNQLHIIAPPADCMVTDLEQIDTTIWLRCNGRSNQVYTGQLSRQSDNGQWTANSTDPFAERKLINSDWQWTVSGRVGNERLGVLRGSLRGEETQLQAGRFLHDSINSAALFFPGRIEIATENAGWYQASRGLIPATELTRTQLWEVFSSDGLQFNQVHLVYDDAPDSPSATPTRLCLATADGEYRSIGIDGSTQEPATCVDYLGRDAMWIYNQAGTGLSITPRRERLVGGLVERSLIEGLFGDDIVVSTPQYIQASTSVEACTTMYWYPTQLGILAVDANFERCLIYAAPFSKLPEGTAPTAIGQDMQGNPIYYGGDGVYSLREQIPLTIKPIQLPAGVEPRLIQMSERYIRVRWQQGNKWGWTIFDRTLGIASHNQYSVSMLDDAIWSYNTYADQWGLTANTVTFNFGAERAEFTVDGPVFTVEYQAAIAIGEVIQIGDEFFIIHSMDVGVLDINSALIGALER